MLAVLYIAAYILIGVVTAIFFGRKGLFDYSPTSSQVYPQTLLYLTTFAWPIFYIFLLGGGILDGVSWLHNSYKKVAKVRR